MLRTFCKWRTLSHVRYFSSSFVTLAKKLEIYFGSQTGNAQQFAEQLRDDAEFEAGFDAEVIDLKQFKPERLFSSQDAINVFITACYGEGNKIVWYSDIDNQTGQPTDNAKKFYDWIMAKERENDKGWDKLKFTLFGLGIYYKLNSIINLYKETVQLLKNDTIS